MRLLEIDSNGELGLTKDVTPLASYAILSHTWGADDDEVTFDDVEKKTGYSKAGYAKLWFCANQAKRDGLDYCWVDSCCINKANLSELSKAITSMFSWYQSAAKCYVYLSDVSVGARSQPTMRHTWEADFKTSRWWTRGWTLQELLAPASVELFSVEGQLLGTKQTLERLIHEITTIPVAALTGTPLSTFSIDERLRWTEGRNTKETEDKAYCLLGIFGVYMPLIYGEGLNAYTRLREEIQKGSGETTSVVRDPPVDILRLYTIVHTHSLDSHSCAESFLYGPRRRSPGSDLYNQQCPHQSCLSRPMSHRGDGDGRAGQE